MKLLESLPQIPLTPSDEAALASDIQRHLDDDESINRLVLHNMKEAFLYAKKVCRSKISDDEIFSLCYSTLRRNAKRFQPGSIRFFSFAKAGLRGAISRYWRTLGVVKNSSVHETESGFQGFPKKPRREAYEESNIDIAESAPTFSDWLITHPERADADPTQQVIDPDFRGIDCAEKMVFVNEIIERKLTDQEAMIVSLVYTSGFNFQEIGNLLGITRSAAQLSHAKSIKKIRGELLRQKKLLIDQ